MRLQHQIERKVLMSFLRRTRALTEVSHCQALSSNRSHHLYAEVFYYFLENKARIIKLKEKVFLYTVSSENVT